MYCNNSFLRHISLEVSHVADRAQISKEWLITNLPFLTENNRDQIADLINLENCLPNNLDVLSLLETRTA